VFGEPVTVTATVAALSGSGIPTGTVAFGVDGVVQPPVALDAAGQASLDVPSMPVGAHTISAAYVTDSSGFRGSAASPASHLVRAADTRVDLISSRNPSAPGETVTFTARVTASSSPAVPTGTVTFRIDGLSQPPVPMGSDGLAALATSGFAVGRHEIEALYTSDSGNFVSGPPAALSQRVRRDYFAVGSDAGTVGQVNVYDPRTGALVTVLTPYGGFSGGVRVAAGDVDSDGFADIITATGTGATHVRVFSGQTFTEIRSFLAYGAATVGVTVAAGDVDGDGADDIITAAGAGAPGHVKVFSGASGAQIASFFAYSPAFLGGVRVAAGDIDGDGRSDVITGMGSGFASHVKAFSGASFAELASFFAYPAAFEGGVYVAAGDVNGDGRDDIITGAGAAVTHVKIFDAATFAERASFFAFSGLTAGVRVGAVDRDADGLADVIATPSGPPSLVRIYDGLTLDTLDSFFAFGSGVGAFVGGSK
jgi:hypothetical protein